MKVQAGLNLAAISKLLFVFLMDILPQRENKGIVQLR